MSAEAGLRLCPEYEPISRLYLCFVHEFFNTRFAYGKAQCDIIRAASPHVEVEVLVSSTDEPQLLWELEERGVPPGTVSISQDSPGRSILAEHTPIFARRANGTGVALVFENPQLEEPEFLRGFGVRLAKEHGFEPVDLGFGFGTAQLLVNEDLVLLSRARFAGEDSQRNLDTLRRLFPGHVFHVVPPLAGDTTADLDMYLWPVAPRTWIVSEYPESSPEAVSVEPALRVLRDAGHAALRVPGLEPIRRDDIDTMPNYANGVIVNRAALAPAYGRKEDEVVQRILRDCGYEVSPIDCSNIILSNSAIHCISRTIPVDPALQPTAVARDTDARPRLGA